MISQSMSTMEIPLDKIVLGSSQARQRDTKVDPNEDLVLSIKKHGLISPILVKKLNDGKYELLVGQRRFRAHEILKKPTIRAFIVEKDLNEYDAKIISIIENLARKDMKHADYVDGVQFLMDRYQKVVDVAEELGVTPTTVRKYLNISKLPDPIKEDIKNKVYRTDAALKALKALGDDESNVDVNMLRDTAVVMNSLSLPARKKYVDISKHEPGASPATIAEKAKQRSISHMFNVEVTDDQLTRIDKFKQKEGITENEEAASELIDLGLDAADV